MFSKEVFSNILYKINSNYGSMSELSKNAGLDRSYISKYINKKLDNPPSPKILKKIADSSKGIITYAELMEICGYLKTSNTNNEFNIAQKVFDEKITLLDKYHLSDKDLIYIEKILVERIEKDDISVENQINDFAKNITIEDFEKNLSVKDLYNDLISINNSITSILDRYKRADYEYPIPLYENIIVKNDFIDFSNSLLMKYINLNINLQKMNDLIFYFGLVASDNSMAPLLDVGDIAIIKEVSKKTIDENDIGRTYLLQVNGSQPIIRKLVHNYGELGFELHALNTWNFPIQKNVNYNEINILGRVIRAENNSAFE